MGLKKVEWILFFCLLISTSIVEGYSKLAAEIRHDSKLNITRIDMGMKASIHLYRQWQDQAVSGLMAAVASKKISKVSPEDAAAHERCAKSADTVLKHAQCVSELYQKPIIRVQVPPDRDTRTLFNRLKPQQIHQPAKPYDRFSKFKLPEKALQRHRAHETLSILKKAGRNSQRFEKLSKKRNFVKDPNQIQPENLHTPNLHNPINQIKNALKWRATKSIVKNVGAFGIAKDDQNKRRRKRYTMKTASSYQLHDGAANISPLGLVAKHLTKRILNLKNKTAASSWQSVIDKAQKTAAKKQKLKKAARQHFPPNSMEDTVFDVFGHNRFQNDDLDEIFKDKNKRKQMFQKMQQQESKNPQNKLTGLLRQGMKLAYSILGKNTTNFDEKNLKVMSPKLFSVMDENGSSESDDPIDILSPSLLSLHGNGKGLEQELSLPNLVKGFTTADQQQWLDLIFEASGVEETLQKADDALAAEEFQARKKRSYEEKMRGPDGQPLYFTKEKAIETLGDSEAKRIEISETLIKSYTKKQMKEMNETGYAVLNQKQLQLIYGTNSPHEDSKMIEYYANFTAEKVHDQIEKEILSLKAYSYKDDAITDVNLNENIRTKRAIVASPIVGSTVVFSPETTSQPIILSPILFTAVVGSPAIFGPVVLSPWLFLPVILSPRTLSPPILSPLGFVPVVLSPLTMHPVILCPGVFNPVVLSPLTMSPFILSPQVFTPLILSPLVLSPFILNPSVGSPVILSPFVLNPVIFSPLAYTALVLSPNALSPNIHSKLYAAEVILSPSFLS